MVAATIHSIPPSMAATPPPRIRFVDIQSPRLSGPTWFSKDEHIRRRSETEGAGARLAYSPSYREEVFSETSGFRHPPIFSAAAQHHRSEGQDDMRSIPPKIGTNAHMNLGLFSYPHPLVPWLV